METLVLKHIVLGYDENVVDNVEKISFLFLIVKIKREEDEEVS